MDEDWQAMSDKYLSRLAAAYLGYEFTGDDAIDDEVISRIPADLMNYARDIAQESPLPTTTKGALTRLREIKAA